jgi:hypothetical protein
VFHAPRWCPSAPSQLQERALTQRRRTQYRRPVIGDTLTLTATVLAQPILSISNRRSAHQTPKQGINNRCRRQPVRARAVACLRRVRKTRSLSNRSKTPTRGESDPPFGDARTYPPKPPRPVKSRWCTDIIPILFFYSKVAPPLTDDRAVHALASIPGDRLWQTCSRGCR